MAQILAIPAFAQIRERRREAKTEAVSNLINAIPQAMMVYANFKNREELERIAIFDKMLQTYKDQAPQSMLAEYDQTLRNRYKVGLPTDPATGDFMTPSPTLNELVAREARNKPELLQAKLQKELTGMSPLQVHFKELELTQRAARDKAMAADSHIRAEAARVRALTAQAKAAKGEEFSGIVAMPDGTLRHISEVQDAETGQVPPGTVALMGKQADRAIALYKANVDAAMKESADVMKKSRLELDQIKAANYLMFRAGATLMSMAKLWSDPKTTEEYRAQIAGGLVQMLTDAGVHEENIPGFLRNDKGDATDGSLAQFINRIFGTHPAVGAEIEREHALKGVPKPPVGGQMRSSSGKVFTLEEVPEDDYDARMQQLTAPPPAGPATSTPAAGVTPSVTQTPTLR